MENIVNAPKTDMFRFRINPEIRSQVEEIYAKNGISFTQAINIFIQQSLNAGGFPFLVNEDLDAGRNSGPLVDEAEAYRLLEVTAL